MSNESSAAVSGETCARCHTTESWGSSSWCPRCGYYPSLDKEGINDETWKQHVSDDEESPEDETLFGGLPNWFWILIAGVAGILVLGLTIRMQAAEEESLRGLIALSVVGLAIPVIAVAHICACRYAMKHDPRISVVDGMISWFNIWQPSIGQLPATRKRTWAVSWGGTAMVTALLIVGGIDYGAPFRNDEKVDVSLGKSKVLQAVTGAAQAAGKNSGSANMQDALGQISDPSMMAAGAPTSMEEAVNGLAAVPEELPEMAAAGGEVEPAEEPEVADQHMLCVVYGVLTNDERVPTGFLFAGKPRTKYQHIAEISAEELTKKDYQRLAGHLARRVQKSPALPSSYDAVWVDPVLVCKLKYVRMNQDGTVYKPVFDDIIRDGHQRTAKQQPHRQ